TRKALLVVGPSAERLEELLACLEAEDIEIVIASDGPAARRALEERAIDCVVVRSPFLGLLDGLPVLPEGEAVFRRLPVIVYGEANGAEELKRPNNAWLLRRAHSP